MTLENFVHPEVLWVVPILVAAAGLLWRRSNARQLSVQIPSSALLHALPRTLRERLRRVPFVMRVSALVWLIVALAGPQGTRVERREDSPGLDVALILDVSRSMLALDMEPNRLGAAKRVAATLVRKRPRDRFAVVTFAGDVQTNCPLTRDQAAILSAVRAADGSRRPDGTALGSAIAQGVSRLRAAADRSGAVVVFTDGSSNAGDVDPATAGALARASGIRIYTVGIGSTKPVPYPTEFGPVSVSLVVDEKTLDMVARRSGGQYFSAADVRALDAVSRDLDRFEPTSAVIRSRTTVVDFSHLAAVLALLCVAVERLAAGSVCRVAP